ncbi:SET domain-containing protein [Aulographum hederae CBS 113979]|uniref:SET domain-containing protein n=1 Tax=Aulographum hederae CBS 113979 TaxID=1176131 RepID=A0A6G1GZ04_9PEZI|nr:SET domain-containing protein [Aulographum hederae CBS 113979]
MTPSKDTGLLTPPSDSPNSVISLSTHASDHKERYIHTSEPPSSSSPPQSPLSTPTPPASTLKQQTQPPRQTTSNPPEPTSTPSQTPSPSPSYKIAPSPLTGGGRGLFATRPIPPFTSAILTESPFCRITGARTPLAIRTAVSATVETRRKASELWACEEKVQQSLDMLVAGGWGEGVTECAELREWAGWVGVWEGCGICLEDEDGGDEVYGSEEDGKRAKEGKEEDRNGRKRAALYSILPMINHSCDPNAYWAPIPGGDGWELGLWALREIRAGEEIFVSYVEAMMGRRERRRRLREDYFFECACRYCDEGF